MAVMSFMDDPVSLSLTLQLDFQAQRSRLRKRAAGSSTPSGQRPALEYLKECCLTWWNANCLRTASSVRDCFRNSGLFPTEARLNSDSFVRQDRRDKCSPFLVDKDDKQERSTKIIVKKWNKTLKIETKIVIVQRKIEKNSLSYIFLQTETRVCIFASSHTKDEIQ